jgi:coenzyme F420 hydrogenase subunit beta
MVGRPKKGNVITQVVERERCSCCGVCAGVCPGNALSMGIQKNGDLAPYMHEGFCKDKCRLCLDICPFSEGAYNPRETNIEIFSSRQDSRFEENIGWYLSTIIGFRCDDELRRNSASGGLATWCLETLLREGIVTRVAVIRLAAKHDKGFFEFHAASTIDELRSSSGSIYHPVEISGIIKQIIASKQDRWAIVGVPCMCTAVRKLVYLRKKIPFVFGLACGMYDNTFYTEMLLDKSGVDRKHIVSIEYRRKSDSGPPYNFRFRGTDNRRHGKEIPYRGLPYFIGKNAYFRQNACNYCMDVFAETADACFMDAWLPECMKDPKGTSLVVIRDERISELFQKGFDRCEIWVDKIGPEQVVRSQCGHVRNKRKLIYMRLGMGKWNNTDVVKPNIIVKARWWLEKRAQTRGKRAWANYGRRYGRFVFWLAVIDIVLLQTILDNVVNIYTMSKIAIRKLIRVLIPIATKGQRL